MREREGKWAVSREVVKEKEREKERKKERERKRERKREGVIIIHYLICM